MHICYITNIITKFSGGERFFIELAQEMRKRGHEVTLIGGGSDPIAERDLKEQGIEVYTTSVLDVRKLPYQQPKNTVRMLFRLNERIGECGKDVILHTNNHFPNLFSYKLRIPVVGSIYHLEDLAQYNSILAKYMGYIIQDILEINAPYTVLHVISRHVANLIRRKTIIPRPIVVIPVGIRLERHLEVYRSPEPGLFVMIGRFETRKHYDHAIYAMKLVKKVNPDIKLVIIGDGPMKPMIESLIEKYSLRKNVILLGNVDEERKLDLLGKAEALIHLGYPEGFGLVIIEAYAVGTPAIAYNVAPLNELIKHGKTGVLVPKDDVVRLALSISTFRKDKFDVRYLKDIAREYNFENIAPKFEKLYKNLIYQR